MADIGRLYDITKDYLYRKGIAEGRKKVKREFIITLLATRKCAIEEIADYASVTAAYVKAIARELQK